MSSVAESRSDRVRTDRIPPYSEEAERGVLGAALLDAERVLDLCLSRGIGPDGFYLRPHQVLFEELAAMHRASRHIDLLTASQRLRDLGVMEAVGGPAYLDQLVDSTPTPAHAEFYIDILHQKFLFRAMIQRARDTIDACYNAEEEADEILGKAEQGMFDIADMQRHAARSWQDMVKVTMAEIETVFQTKKGLTGLPTGFQDFDRMLMGLQAGDMVILAARPSMGKTSLAMNIVEHVATGYAACTGSYRDQQSAPVGVFSLEMSGEQLVRRMICCSARIPSHKLAGGYISKDNHTALVNAADLLTKARIVLDDTPGLSVLDLRSRARRMARKFQIRLLVVDYLQLLNYPQFARENRQRETAAISGALKAMAKELRIPVLVLSQLSRAPETRDRLAVPKLSDLRDSGSIEQDADVVLLLRRPCKYPDDPEAEDRTLAVVEVAKHRNGPTGEVRLNFTEDFTRFSDRARHDRGDEPPPQAEEEFGI
jgi:replicative DNA helicase